MQGKDLFIAKSEMRKNDLTTEFAEFAKKRFKLLRIAEIFPSKYLYIKQKEDRTIIFADQSFLRISQE